MEQPSTKLVWGSPKSGGDSISPDGRYVSYTDWDTGNLMLHDFVTDTGRVLTTAGRMKRGDEAYSGNSAISRDGKQVAYQWWDYKVGHAELWVANLTPIHLPSGDQSPRD